MLKAKLNIADFIVVYKLFVIKKKLIGLSFFFNKFFIIFLQVKQFLL